MYILSERQNLGLCTRARCLSRYFVIKNENIGNNVGKLVVETLSAL